MVLRELDFTKLQGSVVLGAQCCASCKLVCDEAPKRASDLEKERTRCLYNSKGPGVADQKPRVERGGRDESLRAFSVGD